MSEYSFTIDGVKVQATPDETILQAADRAGIYIPRLCSHPELAPHGSCRVCTVKVNGRFQAACTQPAAEGNLVENDTEELLLMRRSIVEMMFAEGNHFCPACERSGSCELQALGYRFGVAAPQHAYQYTRRELDASHPDVLLDRNRCVLCGRCQSASRDLDGKSVFGFTGRGSHKRVAVNADSALRDTDLKKTDKAAAVCPVGTIVVKRGAFRTPVGERKYDHEPIGSDIEARRK